MALWWRVCIKVLIAFAIVQAGTNGRRIVHPKLYGVNDTEDLEGTGAGSTGDNYSTYIVVMKEDSDAEVQGQSSMMDFLLGASSQERDVYGASVRSFTTVNIGYMVDMNDAALEEVSV